MIRSKRKRKNEVIDERIVRGLDPSESEGSSALGATFGRDIRSNVKRISANVNGLSESGTGVWPVRGFNRKGGRDARPTLSASAKTSVVGAQSFLLGWAPPKARNALLKSTRLSGY